MVSVSLVLVFSLVLRNLVSVGARWAEYGFGPVDQLYRWCAVGPHIDHLEVDTESDAVLQLAPCHADHHFHKYT